MSHLQTPSHSFVRVRRNAGCLLLLAVSSILPPCLSPSLPAPHHPIPLYGDRTANVRQLVANDSFTRVLNEMYAWGKRHGWDPAALRPGAGAAQQPPAA